VTELLAITVDRGGAIAALLLAVLIQKEALALPRSVNGVYFRWLGGLILAFAAARAVSHLVLPAIAGHWAGTGKLFEVTGAFNTVLFAGLAVATGFHRQTSHLQQVVVDERERLRTELAEAQSRLQAHRDRLVEAVATARTVLRQVVEDADYSQRFPNPAAPLCWERVECPEPDCPARGNVEERCWRVRGGAEADRPCRFESCPDCPVYREATADEIGALAETVNDLLYLLERSAGERRLYLSALSHDIRGQLGSVRGFLELLADPQTATNPQELVSLARFALERVTHLAETLVLDGRAKAGMLEPQPRPLGSGSLLEKVLAAFSPHAEMRGVDTRIVVEPGCPDRFRADPLMLERALANLVDNALKHSPQGTAVTLRASAGERGGIRFAVEDQGPGIPADRRHDVFRPFRSWDEGGSGLGLFVVAAVARAHGGRAWVEDGPAGRGTRFWIEIPGGEASEGQA